MGLPFFYFYGQIDRNLMIIPIIYVKLILVANYFGRAENRLKNNELSIYLARKGYVL
jgi:hypothetical protein